MAKAPTKRQKTKPKPKRNRKTSSPFPPPDNVDYSTEFIDEDGGGSSRRIFTVVTIVLVLVSAVAAYLIITDQNPFWSSASDNDNYAQQIDETLNQDEADLNTTPDEEAIGTDPSPDLPEENTSPETNDPPPKQQTDTQKATPPVEEEDPPLVDYRVSTNYYQSFRYMPQRPNNATKILVSQPRSRYYIVLGSFDLEKNAYSFYNNLIQKGISTAKIIVPGTGNPRYRVTYDDFATKVEAREKGKTFGKTNSLDLWVLAY